MNSVKVSKVMRVAVLAFTAWAAAGCFKMHTPAGLGSSLGGVANGQLNNSPANPGLVPTFASINEFIIQPKCVSCHNSSLKSGNYDMSNYTNTVVNSMVVPFNPTTSPLYLRVADGTMAPGSPLSATEKQAIAQWITNGGLNDGTVAPPVSPTPTPIPLTATFTSISQNILFPKCLSCHNATLARDGYSVATYQATMKRVVAGNASSSGLYQSVLSDMPQGLPSLTNAEKAAIQNWINNGALNN
jgi:uncharacterized membrane protein